MKKGWEIIKLGDIVDTINGLWTGKKEPYISVKVYTMSNFTKDCEINYSKEPREIQASISQYEKRKLIKGDLLLEKSGGGPNQPVGRVIHFDIENDENNTFSNFTTRLRLNEKFQKIVDSDYIHKYLKLIYINGGTERFQNNSTNIRNLQLKDYLQIQIPLPSLHEQKRIVNILDKAFAEITQAKANAEQNLKNTKELFESYLNGIFENKGDDWEAKKLIDVTIKIGSGATPRGGKASYKEEGISLVRSMNVHDFDFKEKNLAFIDDKQADGLSNVILEKNDVLLNITGASIARCCIIPEKYLPARVNQHVSIIRVKQDLVFPLFLNSLLVSNYYKKQILETGEQGATRQAITKAQIENFIVYLPKTVEEQKKLVQELNQLKIETKKLELIYQQKLDNLEELKKSILQKAFNGEL